jgi:hypothetical protein
VPFALGLTLTNLGEGANAAEPDVVDPSPGFGDGGEQRLFAIGSSVGEGDMTPKPLPARIKDWQRNGSLVEMTSLEIRGRRALKPRI